MRFSNAATLFSLATFAQAAPAPAANPHLSLKVPHTRQHQTSGQYQNGIFYVNWAIYGRQHFVTDLPADKLTKVNYAFANINNVTGEVFLTDEWADVQYGYPGDVPTNGSQLLGNFNQLFKLKQKNRNLKVVLSVGGWSYRANFSPGLSTAAQRLKFCSSATTLIADLGLDGLDIDWEYPRDSTDAANLVDTAKICRGLFDEYSTQFAGGYRFALGISAPAGPQFYTILPIAKLDKYVDNFNLMAFDYQGGGFSNFTGHQSNVFPSLTNPKATTGWVVEQNKYVPFNTKEAIDYYKSQVKSSQKIHLGMPLYGRSFANVIDLSKDKRGLGQKFNGSGEGTWEAGTLDLKALPQNGTKVYTDKQTIASWSWDAVKKQLVSFDTAKVALLKTEYLKIEGLGGSWFWESSGDFAVGDSRSQVSTVAKALGGPSNFKVDHNNLYYPKSKYYNIASVANSTVAARF